MRSLVPIALMALVLAGCGKDEETRKAASPPSGPLTATRTPTEKSPPPASQRSGRPRATAPRRGRNPPRASRTAPAGRPAGIVAQASGPVGDQQAVVRAVRQFLLAVAADNGDRACAQFTPGGQRYMERKLAKISPETAGAPCRAVILLYQNAYGRAIRNPSITRVRVSGRRAQASGPANEPATLVKQRNVWRMTRWGE